jgi:hypothetical protein
MVRRFLAAMLWLVLALGGCFVALYGSLILWWSGVGDETTFLGVPFPVGPAVVGGCTMLVGALAILAAWLLHDRWGVKRQDPRH